MGKRPRGGRCPKFAGQQVVFGELKKEGEEDDDNSTTLDSNRRLVEEDCPVIKKSYIYIQLDVWNKVKLLAQKEKQEWLAVLRGKRLNQFTTLVTGIEIPEQERSWSDCKMLEKVSYADAVGWIHSHHDMEAFMSSTDQETNSKTQIGMVVNAELEMEGVMMVKAPCGFYFKVDSDITIIAPDYDQKVMDKWYEEAQKKFLPEKEVELNNVGFDRDMEEVDEYGNPIGRFRGEGIKVTERDEEDKILTSRKKNRGGRVIWG